MKLIKQDSASKRILLAFALLFVLHRLLFLNADPSGLYANADESNHTHNARNIVLYGTAFHDSYNPSALMPVSTWYKVPFLVLLGINLYGMRIPSVLATVGSALLLGWMLLRRRENVAAVLTVVYCGLSFIDFSHSRMGIQDPVLVLFAAATLFFTDRAIEGGAPLDYSLAFLGAVCSVFVKTSGIFVPAAVAACLLHARFIDKKRIPARSIALALGVSAAFLACLLVFWIIPHWEFARRYFIWEIVNRKTQDPLHSMHDILKALALLAPLPAALALSRLVWFLRGILGRKKSTDPIDAFLFGWLLGCIAALTYSSLLYWRWIYWMFLPLVGLGARELVRLVDKPLSARVGQWARTAELGLFIAPMLCMDFPSYAHYYRTMTFDLWYRTPDVEAVVGSSVVSGSGFESFAANSSRINHVSSFDYSELSSCWEVQRAFPSPDKIPRFVSMDVGNDARQLPKVVDAFFKGCPEWASNYQVFGLVRKLYEPGMYVWFVRKRGA